MDLFVVPTIGFDLLYAFVIVRLDRRDLVWIPMSQERVDFVQRQDRFLNGRFSRKAAVRWLNTSRCHGAVPSSLAFKAPECRHPSAESAATRHKNEAPPLSQSRRRASRF
jgi:hypothetical protein